MNLTRQRVTTYSRPIAVQGRSSERAFKNFMKVLRKVTVSYVKTHTPVISHIQSGSTIIKGEGLVIHIV